MVERKHINILEMDSALRFQTSLNCVMTAVHITNKLLGSILKHKSSYEVLHNIKPEHDHLRVLLRLLTYVY